MKAASPMLVFALLVSVTYTLATSVCLRAASRPNAISSDGVFKKLLGDGRRLFAGQFVEIADVYLHSGYYPSIFDRQDVKAPKAVTGKISEEGDEGHEGHQHDAAGKCVHRDESQDEHEKAMDFMGEPRDWLEGFIRRFRITKHTHLEQGQEREVLPWLKLAIELDPQAIETYTSTAYWLRKRLGKIKDAQEVLREGIRNNPNSHELLFEMGKLYKEGWQDTARARNLWLQALKRWAMQPAEAKEASALSFGEITVNLARLEADAGNWPQAIRYFEAAKSASPNPDAIQAQINELQARTRGMTNTTPSILPFQ